MFSLNKEYFEVRLFCSGLEDDLDEKDGCSLKSRVGLSLKYHLCLIHRQKSVTLLRNSDSFGFFCIGTNSRPFSRTFISVPITTFLLRINTVSGTKLPDNLHCSVRTDEAFIWDWHSTGFRGRWRPSRILRISLPYSSWPLLTVILLAF